MQILDNLIDKLSTIEAKHAKYSVWESSLGFISYAVTRDGFLVIKMAFETYDKALLYLMETSQAKKFSLTNMEKDLKEACEIVLDAVVKCEIENKADIPIDKTIWTEFRTRVYDFLLNVPEGTQLTYGQIAEFIGSPRAYRAVGTSMKNNPLPLILPCHRVKHSCSKKDSFSAEGGTELKKKLLRAEGADV